MTTTTLLPVQFSAELSLNDSVESLDLYCSLGCIAADYNLAFRPTPIRPEVGGTYELSDGFTLRVRCLTDDEFSKSYLETCDCTCDCHEDHNG